MCAVHLVGGGLIIEVNIHMCKNLRVKEGGAYFQEDMVHVFKKVFHTIPTFE